MNIVIIFILSCLFIGLFICLFMLAAISGILGKSVQLTFGHNNRFSEAANNAVKGALDNCNKVTLGVYNILLETDEGNVEVWIKNKYYSYCSRININGKCEYDDVRISLKQALRIHRLEQYLLKNNGVLINTPNTENQD